MRSLIFGVRGQDGSYLADYLLSNGEEVIGAKRRSCSSSDWRLKIAKQNKNFLEVDCDITDFSSVLHLINEYQPDKIFNLAAQSQVGTSFNQPFYTFNSITIGTTNILESMRILNSNARFYHACHDSKTKVVTYDGIKNYEDIHIGDLVYSLNEETQEIELKPVINIYDYDYNGNIVNLKNKRIDQCITLNHNILSYNESNNKLEKFKAEEYLNKILYERSSKYRLPLAKHIGKNEEYYYFDNSNLNKLHKNVLEKMEIKDAMFLLGLYIGDGYIKKYKKSSISKKERLSYRNANGCFASTKPTYTYVYGNTIEFCVPVNDKAHLKLLNILNKYKLDFYITKNKISVGISSVSLSRFLKLAGHKFDKKIIPKFVFEYSQEILCSLLDGLLYSDGCFSGNKKSYSTANENLANQIVILSFFCGKYASLSKSKNKANILKNGRIIKGGIAYQVYISDKSPKLYNNLYQTEKYTGKVWCLEVKDNHNFLIFRNGKYSFSGNSTSEMFGSSYDTDNQTGRKYQDENTKFVPRSPYGVAKLAAHQMVCLYRDAYSLWACSGILFNHCSPRRGEYFVSRKITKWIGETVNGYTNEPIKLGNLRSYRDWGHAKDYVVAMDLMLKRDQPKDYVIGTGETYTVYDFWCLACLLAGIDREKIVIEPSLMRPAEVDYLCAKPDLAKKELGWQPQYDFKRLVKDMVNADINNAKK